MSGIVLDSFRPGLLYGSNLVNIQSPMIGWLGAEPAGVWSRGREMGLGGWASGGGLSSGTGWVSFEDGGVLATGEGGVLVSDGGCCKSRFLII